MFDPSLTAQSKDAVFKLSEKIPFLPQSNKPYNCFMAAFISGSSRSATNCPGTYIQIDSEMIHLRFGVLQGDTNYINKLRDGIITNYEDLNYIISHRNFKSYFGKLNGSIASDLPSVYQGIVVTYPIIESDQFYCQVDIDITLLTAGKLLELIVQHYKMAKPLLNFLSKVTI